MLAPWEKSYDQHRQHIKKQRLYFAKKSLSSQSFGFSSSHVRMWELDYKESWALKNWCFWTVVLEKTLESPWTSRRANQSILKEIRLGCSLEGMMLKLKLQYFGHLMQRVDSLEKTLMLEGIGVRRRRGRQRMRWLVGITDSMDVVWVNSRSWWWTGRPGVLRFMGSQRVRHDWATVLILSDLSQCYDCPVWTMYGCTIWTIKKFEHQRIDGFEMWCWRSLLRVPWTARRSNQSILKEINPEYSLERLMLKLKL